MQADYLNDSTGTQAQLDSRRFRGLKPSMHARTMYGHTLMTQPPYKSQGLLTTGSNMVSECQ